jgi:hypothetical protein
MKRTIIAAILTLSASAASAQDAYVVPRQEGVISRLFRMQQDSDAAARQEALQNEQMRLMEAQRKVLEAQARAINGALPQMPMRMQDLGRDQAAVYCSGGRAASRVGAQRYADCKAWFPTVTH